MAFLIAVGQLIKPKRLPRQYVAALLFLTIAAGQAYNYLLFSGLLYKHIYLMRWQMPFNYLFGPLFYIFVKISIRQEILRKRDLWHFLLPLLSIAVVLQFSL